MSDVTDYELSRAYANGWTAAKKNFSDTVKGALNPYPAGAEFDRWAVGYAEALASVASVKDAHYD